MSNRFTDHLSQVWKIAEDSAELYKTQYIGSEHILLAMLCVNDCSAAKLLTEAGVTLEKYREQFRNRISHDGSWQGITPRTRKLIDDAAGYAFEANQPLIGTEHALRALLNIRDSVALRILGALGVVIPRLLWRCNEFIFEGLSDAEAKKEKGTNAAGDRVKLSEKRQAAAYADEAENKRADGETYKSPLSDEILQFGEDLTRRAAQGKIDPVIGRRKETEKLVQILSRRTKNNPVLIGEPGVGKSAVVEGLALAIIADEVPDILRGKTVFSLNMSTLVAGTRYRGDFEQRLTDLMEELASNRDVIMFIDEIHLIVGAGSSTENKMDAANILKPMLARGELQTIGATTLEEYRKYIEQDAALERRFTPVLVEEPSVEDTVAILQGIKGKYEAHHNIIITDEAIEAAARLSDRYITDRFLPDKAIDLVDEAASRMRLNSFNGPAELRETADKIKRLKTEYNNALKWGDGALADELSVKIGKLSGELQKLQSAWDDKRSSTHLSIGAEEVAEIVGARTGIPVSRLTEEESERLLNLEEELHARIVGQDEAVSAVARAIRRARAGLKDPNRPVGSFIFVGPTGVGKTDLSKALAVSMFGDEDLLIRLDMSEYMSKESVNKMIGTAPGYVGFEEAGQLTERVRRKPYSVVLFDEIEKAHPDVFNILLQILDDGRLTDNRGRVVSFKNTVIILTSNVGAHEVNEVAALGFRSSDEESAYNDMRERIQTALKARFKPEFLNRLDETVVFHKLSKEDATKICGKILEGLRARMRARGILLEVTQEAKRKLVELGYSEEYGARPLKRTVQREVEDLLSEAVLTGEVREGSTAVLDFQSGIFTVSAE